MKKKRQILLFMLLASALVFTACGKKEEADSSSQQETASQETESTEEQITEETGDIGASGEEVETEENENSVEENAAENGLENVPFTVDITDNLIGERGMVIGNTSTSDGYSGIIEIYLAEELIEKAAETIEVGKTYIFTVQPMMTMSIPPQTTAVDFVEASQEDIQYLEEIRKTISNFKDCMESYQNMSLEEIIGDANFNYALWTQEEITEFIEFIGEKGYTDDSEVKSYVATRENLSGSISGASTAD